MVRNGKAFCAKDQMENGGDHRTIMLNFLNNSGKNRDNKYGLMLLTP